MPPNSQRLPRRPILRRGSSRTDRDPATASSAVHDGTEASLSEIAERTLTDRSSVAALADGLGALTEAMGLGNRAAGMLCEDRHGGLRTRTRTLRP